MRENTLFREPELPVPGTQPNRGGFGTARVESLDRPAGGDSEETPSLYSLMQLFPGCRSLWGSKTAAPSERAGKFSRDHVLAAGSSHLHHHVPHVQE